MISLQSAGLTQAGVDLYRVQRLLGHKSITMTMRYAHHHPESLRSSIEVLDSLSQFYHNRLISESASAFQKA
jgi:integrase